MTKIHQILTGAANLLAQPGAWTKHALARDTSGLEVKPESPAAVSFCAMGALDRIAYDLGCDAHEAFCKLWDHVGGSIATWNNDDRRTKEEVVAAFRQAAQLPEVTQ